MNIVRRRLIELSLASLLAPLTVAAQGRDQVLRLIVPFPPGSITDSMARLLAEAMRQTTGRTVIVENKPGAASVIGSQEVSRAKPDGNTILYTTGGHTTNAALLRKLPYDSLTGFTPITLLGRSPGFALIVNAKSGFQNLGQLLAAAKATPGRYSYGSAGIGGSPHLFGALFAKTAGIELLHVPFKGVPVSDLIAGHIDMIFTGPTVVMEYIKSGQLRILAARAEKRSPQLPDVPTFQELGLDVPDVPGWNGIFGPPGMPPDVLNALYQDLMKAAHQPQYVKRLAELEVDVVGMPPSQFREYVASEITRFKKILPPFKIEID